MHQVRHNLESQRRQDEWAELARQLGFATVTVIDEDQGCSGSGSVERSGFARLLDLVFQGQVGAVLALEASRFAWRATTGIGTIWLTCAPWPKRWSWITTASTIRVY
jgi:DNA invertase Pin-like site-specific DNA recombinase